MHTPIDAFLFYTKLLTGLVLVLNFTTLLSLFLLSRWLRHPEKAIDFGRSGARWEARDEAGGSELVYRPGARLIMFVLLVGVIVVNGLAVFANANLLRATDLMVTLFAS